MRVLFFHRANDYTGSTRALASVIETEYTGQIVTVVTVDCMGGGFLSDTENVKIKKVWYPLVNGQRIKGLSYVISNIHFFVIALLYGWQYNCFYINTITPYPAVFAGRLLRKKIVYHIHEKYTNNSFESRFLEYVLMHTQATRIFVSKYLQQQYPDLSNPGIVKYNNLPQSFISEVSVVPIQNRRRCNIIMISSLTKAKGIYNFIALSKLLVEYNFTLVLSSSEEEINAKLPGISTGNLKVLPAQPNIHLLLKESDLLLNLSIPTLWIETFGLTILEAMAYGIPAIVPNVGGPTELVVDGYNGYCVDVTNLELIEHKIKEILTLKYYSQFAQNSLDRFLFLVKR